MYGFTLDHLGYDVWYNGKHIGDIAQSGSGWYFKTGSYLQSNTDARQCTAVLTGVLIRHRVPITESLTADLMAVVTSREATLLEYLADHARSRVERGAGARRLLQGVPRRFGERRHLVKQRRHGRSTPRQGRGRTTAGAAAAAVARAGGHGRQRQHVGCPIATPSRDRVAPTPRPGRPHRPPDHRPIGRAAQPSAHALRTSRAAQPKHPIHEEPTDIRCRSASSGPPSLAHPGPQRRHSGPSQLHGAQQVLTRDSNAAPGVPHRLRVLRAARSRGHE